MRVKFVQMPEDLFDRLVTTVRKYPSEDTAYHLLDLAHTLIARPGNRKSKNAKYFREKGELLFQEGLSLLPTDMDRVEAQKQRQKQWSYGYQAPIGKPCKRQSTKELS